MLQDKIHPLSVDEVIERTLKNAARIRLSRLVSQIEEQRLGEALAEFDWTAFLHSRWVDTDRPVGSTLDTGTAGRLREEDFQQDIGLRRKNTSGGKLEALERFQLKDSNSDFFAPRDQGLTQLILRYNQPLLRDRGTLVNTGQICIAQFNTQAAAATSYAEVADLLLKTMESDWELYRKRANVAIQRRLLDSTHRLLDQLRRREEIDASPLMIVQAEAIALSREADL